MGHLADNVINAPQLLTKFGAAVLVAQQLEKTAKRSACIRVGQQLFLFQQIEQDRPPAGAGFNHLYPQGLIQTPNLVLHLAEIARQHRCELIDFADAFALLGLRQLNHHPCVQLINLPLQGGLARRQQGKALIGIGTEINRQITHCILHNAQMGSGGIGVSLFQALAKPQRHFAGIRFGELVVEFPKPTGLDPLAQVGASADVRLPYTLFSPAAEFGIQSRLGASERHVVRIAEQVRDKGQNQWGILRPQQQPGSVFLMLTPEAGLQLLDTH